jgi:hypothetical protein
MAAQTVAIPRQATAGRVRGVVLEVRHRVELRRMELHLMDRVGDLPAIGACKTLHGLAFKRWRRRFGELPDKAAHTEQVRRTITRSFTIKLRPWEA